MKTYIAYYKELHQVRIHAKTDDDAIKLLGQAMFSAQEPAGVTDQSIDLESCGAEHFIRSGNAEDDALKVLEGFALARYEPRVGDETLEELRRPAIVIASLKDGKWHGDSVDVVDELSGKVIANYPVQRENTNAGR